MTHFIRTKKLKLYPHHYESEKEYHIGDWLCFKEWKDGKMMSGCFSFEVKDKVKIGDEFKYWLE